VAAIDAADIRYGLVSELGMAEVVASGIASELGVGMTFVVDMIVVRAIDAVVIVIAVLTGGVSGMVILGAGSLSLAVKVAMRSEGKLSILVLESSVDVSCKESSLEVTSSV
jgi:hypothetical protein